MYVRVTHLLLGGAGLSVLIGGSLACDPILIWNATPSSPRGLYVVHGTPAQVGAFAVVRPPPRAASLAAARGYLPRGVPLIKTVAAARGDRVCARGDRVWINGRFAVVRRRADGAGRALPRWQGCETLAAGQVLLLGLGHGNSFDSRYFGTVGRERVIGSASLVWRR